MANIIKEWECKDICIQFLINISPYKKKLLPDICKTLDISTYNSSGIITWDNIESYSKKFCSNISILINEKYVESDGLHNNISSLCHKLLKQLDDKNVNPNVSEYIIQMFCKLIKRHINRLYDYDYKKFIISN